MYWLQGYKISEDDPFYRSPIKTTTSDLSHKQHIKLTDDDSTIIKASFKIEKIFAESNITFSLKPRGLAVRDTDDVALLITDEAMAYLRFMLYDIKYQRIDNMNGE